MSLQEKIKRRRTRDLELRFTLISITSLAAIVWMALIILDSPSELGLFLFFQ